jgi:hypothetical protein
MNNSKKILITVLMLLAVPAALAQTGTITITGAVPSAFSITSNTNAALSATVALGTLTPGNTNTLTTGTVVARLRSNVSYHLSAQAVNTGIGATADDIQATDIGFGITAFSAAGADVITVPARTDAIVAKWDYTGGFPAPVNGLSPFVTATKATLADISANTSVLSGPRISARGNDGTSDNFAQATFGVAVLPQYFTQNASFQSVITLTMTTP